MALIGSYPLVLIGIGVLVIGGTVAAITRLFGVGRHLVSPDKDRTRGHNLAHISLVMGLTLIILGLAIGPH